MPLTELLKMLIQHFSLKSICQILPWWDYKDTIDDGQFEWGDPRLYILNHILNHINCSLSLLLADTNRQTIYVNNIPQ